MLTVYCSLKIKCNINIFVDTELLFFSAKVVQIDTWNLDWWFVPHDHKQLRVDTVSAWH